MQYSAVMFFILFHYWRREEEKRREEKEICLSLGETELRGGEGWLISIDSDMAV